MAPYTITEKLRPSPPVLLTRPDPTPIVMIDAPSPLGATAPMFVSLALLGLDARVGLTDVGELRPYDRLRRLPHLSELSRWLCDRTRALEQFDLVGIGLGAIIALQAALDGAPIGRIIAVDAPSPSYRSSEALATEQFYGGAIAGASRPLSTPTAFGSEAVDLLGAAALIPEVRASWWYRRPGRNAVGEPIPAIPDAELARLTQPVLCINSRHSDVVTGGDHVARIISTSELMRVRTTDTSDEGERRRVATAVQDFLASGLGGH